MLNKQETEFPKDDEKVIFLKMKQRLITGEQPGISITIREMNQKRVFYHDTDGKYLSEGKLAQAWFYDTGLSPVTVAVWFHKEKICYVVIGEANLIRLLVSVVRDGLALARVTSYLLDHDDSIRAIQAMRSRLNRVVSSM